jgi:ABC-2 type transport system permease protein
MTAVYKRELRSYFTGIMGYLFIAFLVLVAGIYAMALNFQGGYPNFEYVLSNMSFIFIIAIPILTMRSVSEDRKQKTDQLLYALPMSTAEIIVGKFLALLTVFGAAVLILCTIPPILSHYGTVNFRAAYAALLGYFCLGGCLIAMGVFISSLTENQVVAAVLGFGAMLLWYLLSSLSSYVSSTAFASLAALCALFVVLGLVLDLLTKNYLFAIAVTAVCCLVTGGVFFYDNTKFEGLFPNLMSSISVFDRFYVFINGTLDLTAIVYMISLCGLFLFFAVQAMEKRRWS